MLEVVLTPETFWMALRDIGGMLSLVFFFAIFAGCRHTSQFNESLKKSFYRASREHKRNIELEDLSVSSDNSEAKQLEKIPKDQREQVQRQFVEYFSFGKYLELHQRIEYLETELDRKSIVPRRSMDRLRIAAEEEEGSVELKKEQSSSEDSFKSFANNKVTTQ
jgi:hypothetical protein